MSWSRTSVLAAAALCAGFLPPGAPAARADLFLVGPGGTHATIQSALDEARVTPGEHEVRVARGTWVERLGIDLLPGDAARLTLSGGWIAPAFVARVHEAAATVVSAAGDGRPLRLDCSAGAVAVDGFTFREGLVYTDDPTESGWGSGGGIAIGARAGCSVSLTGSRIVHNRVVERIPDPAGGVVGGGLVVVVSGGGVVSLADNRILENQVTSLTNGSGGGAYFSVGADARLTVSSTDFEFNQVVAANQAHEAGFVISLHGGNSVIEFSDNRVLDNATFAEETFCSGAGAFSDRSGVQITLRRTEIARNQSEDPESSQLALRIGGGSRATVGDSLVWGSPEGSGVSLVTDDDGQLTAMNLTVTQNARRGIATARHGEGALEIWNSISHGNGLPDFFWPGTVTRAHFTSDPRFAAPELDDFRLRPDSPAIDAGLPDPPGGLGPTDLDLRPRVRGGGVDAGAYETARDPGGTCRVGHLGPLTFIDATAPICACLRDEVLNATRCRGLGDVIFFDSRLPPLPPPGEIGLAHLQLHPWALEGAAFQMTALVLEGDLERPAEIVGAKSGKFGAKDEKVTIRYPAPEGAATLRLRVRYRPVGEQEIRESSFDVLLEPVVE